MDIATIIGIVGGFALIIASILMGSPITAFINAPGLLIVFGGTIMATLIMQRLQVVMGAVKVAMIAFTYKPTPPHMLIAELVDYSTKTRKGGVLSLEAETPSTPFLGRGINMLVDGVEAEEIRSSLRTDLSSLTTRHQVGQKVFKFMGATAPAMGMIGTLIGLVQMLRTLDDPATIGPAMAIALLTTFYGAVLAFLVFNPIADKLSDRTAEEKLAMNIVIAGVDGIARGLNPRVLEDKLYCYLGPGDRKKDDGVAGEGAEKEAA